jgi:hypothetical protein
MSSALMAIAVGGASLLCYLLMTRLQNNRRSRRSPGHGSAADATHYAGGDGWILSNWFGSDRSALDSSGNPIDGGGGGSDSGGGGDGGGAGGGDGGGGGGSD